MLVMGGSKKMSTKATKTKNARRRVTAPVRRQPKKVRAGRQRQGAQLDEGLLTLGLVAPLGKLEGVDRSLHELMQDVGAVRKQLQALDRLKQGRRTDVPVPLLGFSEARRAFERDYVTRVLAATGGNQSEAARQAGMSRSAFRELMIRARSYA